MSHVLCSILWRGVHTGRAVSGSRPVDHVQDRRGGRMLSAQSWPIRPLFVGSARAAAGGRDLRDLAGVQNGRGVRQGAGATRRRRHGHRDLSDGSGAEVIQAAVSWPAILVEACGHMGHVRWSDPRRRPGTPAKRNLDDEGFLDHLATGKVGIQGTAHGFLGPQGSFLPLWLSRHDAEGEVRGIELAPERVAVLAQDHLAHIVDEVVFEDSDQGGRGAGPPDPDLANSHCCCWHGQGGGRSKEFVERERPGARGWRVEKRVEGGRIPDGFSDGRTRGHGHRSRNVEMGRRDFRRCCRVEDGRVDPKKRGAAAGRMSRGRGREGVVAEQQQVWGGGRQARDCLGCVGRSFFRHGCVSVCVCVCGRQLAHLSHHAATGRERSEHLGNSGCGGQGQLYLVIWGGACVA